ncbi:hypothetical protein RUND412_003097, partial [Rhizina undulata]
MSSPPTPTYDIYISVQCKSRNLPKTTINPGQLFAVLKKNDPGNETLFEYRKSGLKPSASEPWKWSLNISNIPKTGLRLSIGCIGQDPQRPESNIELSELEKGKVFGAHDLKLRWSQGCEKKEKDVIVKIFVFRERLGNNLLTEPFIVEPYSSNSYRISSLLSGFFAVSKVLTLNVNVGKGRSLIQPKALQFPGPLPPALSHEFYKRTLVKLTFEKWFPLGTLTNWLIRKGHKTMYGENRINEEIVTLNLDTLVHDNHAPTDELPNDFQARQFLEMVKNGKEYEVYTFVLTTNGEFRFAEKGKQKFVNMVSKHVILSDVAPKVAFAGEFFVRRIDITNGLGRDQIVSAKSIDPSRYELWIDNDSGTYQPSEESLMEHFAPFLRKMFPGLR